MASSAFISSTVTAATSRRSRRPSRSYARYSFSGKACPFMLKLRCWWQLPGLTACEELFPVGHGSHATPSEIAITQSAYPDHIKQAACEPRIASSGPIREAMDYPPGFPSRIGSDPLLASPTRAPA